jgi:hypothetical protein
LLVLTITDRYFGTDHPCIDAHDSLRRTWMSEA